MHFVYLLCIGNCDVGDALYFIAEESFSVEHSEILRHYRARNGEGLFGTSCQASNWCVYTLEQSDNDVVCTTQNTGSTGHNGTEEPVSTTTTTGTIMDNELACKDICEWQDAGESRKEINVILKMVIELKMFVCFLTLTITQ